MNKSIYTAVLVLAFSINSFGKTVNFVSDTIDQDEAEMCTNEFSIDTGEDVNSQTFKSVAGVEAGSSATLIEDSKSWGSQSGETHTTVYIVKTALNFYRHIVIKSSKKSGQINSIQVENNPLNFLESAEVNEDFHCWNLSYSPKK